MSLTASAKQIGDGSYNIMGVMIESNLVEGNQPLVKGKEKELKYGQSITDACIGWDDTVKVISFLGACRPRSPRKKSLIRVHRRSQP